MAIVGARGTPKKGQNKKIGFAKESTCAHHLVPRPYHAQIWPRSLRPRNYLRAPSRGAPKKPFLLPLPLLLLLFCFCFGFSASASAFLYFFIKFSCFSAPAFLLSHARVPHPQAGFARATARTTTRAAAS